MKQKQKLGGWRVAVMVIICAIIFTGLGPTAYAGQESTGNDDGKVYCSATIEDAFTENEIIIVIAATYNNREYTVEDFSSINCINLQELSHGVTDGSLCRIIKLTISGGSKANVLQAISQLEQREDIYSAEPNYIEYAESVPNDPQYTNGSQWAIDKISLPSAWNITTGSSTVLVGVIDSGIDATHPDLISRVNTGLSRCFTSDFSTALADASGHGTHVAGIIGAAGNNSYGVTGVCWDVSLVSLRVANSSGTLSLSAVIEAIEYADSVGIKILNFSGGWTSNNGVSSCKVAIENYSGLFVCSAGNANADNDATAHYPSNYRLPNLIAVGGSTSTDQKRSASNYGKTTVDIFAPGENILSTIPGGTYGYKSGTSMAAPHVTGVAALLLSRYPDLSPCEIKQTILLSVDTCDSAFSDLCVSGGRLNAYKALTVVREHYYTYTSLGITVGHKCTCQLCGYTCTKSHSWKDFISFFKCLACGAKTTAIPVTPTNASEEILGRMNEMCIADGDCAVYLDDNTVLCLVEEQFYLVKAQSTTEALSLLHEELAVMHQQDEEQ